MIYVYDIAHSTSNSASNNVAKSGEPKKNMSIWGGVGVFYGPNLKSIVILFCKKKVGVIFFTSI